MALSDRVRGALRSLLDIEREERTKAESPSADALRHAPSSIYAVWGREDIGGLLSVSQNLMDRYADYEAMMDFPDTRTAVLYFANDACQPNMDNRRVAWVTGKDAAIVGAADTLLKKRLRMEDEMFPLAFQLCQYGNTFDEVLATERGVIGLNALPAPTMRRVERLDGTLIGFVQDVTGRFTADQHELRQMLAGSTEIPKHIAVFEDWQVLQMRLRGTVRRSPYGVAVTEGARWIWKRLVMMLDSVMIYKLTRAPARYAFYVDVTDVPSHKVERYLRDAKRDNKKKPMVNPRTGKLDFRYSPLANDEDFYIAVRDGRELSRVEVLSGPDYQNVDDVEFFQKMLHGALMIPRAWLGQDEPIPARSMLSTEDVRAARMTLSVQRELRNGMERLIRLDQAARGMRGAWRTEFDVNMTIPSGIYELMALEIKNARADFAARVRDFMSLRWIWENVFRLSDMEIDALEKQRKKEAREADGMGMDPTFGAFSGGLPPEPPPMEAPPPANGNGQEPKNLDQEPDEKPKSPQEWKRYDAWRRLEEKRDKFSRTNHQMLIDKLNESLENDRQLERRIREVRGLAQDLRQAAIRKNHGAISAVPSVAANGRSWRNAMN